MADGQVVIDITGDESEYRKSLSRLEGEARKSAGGMGQAFKAAAGALAGLAAAVGFGQLVKEAGAATDATQKFKQTLDFAGLGTEQIDALTKSTKEYADKTVYELSDIQNVTAQLAANSVPNYDKLAEAAGNLNAVAGGNAETFKSVGMVLTQTAGAGKLTTENWNQLSNAIPGASGKLQEAMEKNGAFTGNFREAMEKGEITAEEFNQAIMDLGMTDMAEEAATSTTTFEGAFGNLQATVVGGLSEIIEKVQPAITGTANLLSDVLGPAFSKVADWVGGAVDSLAALKDAVAGASDVSGAMSTAFSGLSEIVSQALEGLIGYMAEHMTHMAELMSTLIPQLAPVLIEGVTTLVTTIAGLLPTLLPQLLEGVTALVGAVAAVLPEVLPQLAEGVATLVTSLAEVLPTLIPVLVEGAVALFMALVEALPEIIPPLVECIPTVIQALVDVLPTLIPALMDGAVQLFVAIVEALPQIIPALLAAAGQAIMTLVSYIPTLVGSLGSAALTLFRAIVDAVPKIVGALRSAVTSLLGQARSAVTGFVGQMASAGRDLIRGVVNGISDGADWVRSKIQQVCSNALEALKSFFGIHSPSTVMADMGGYLMRGLADGIGDTGRLAVKAMGRAMEDVAAKAKDGAAGLDVPMNIPMPAFSRGALGFEGSLSASLRQNRRVGGRGEENGGDGLEGFARRLEDGLKAVEEAVSRPVDIRYNRREFGRLVKEANGA